MEGMPDLTVMTLFEAIEYLDGQGIPYEYVVYGGLYKGDQSAMGFTDYLELLTRLDRIGATPTDVVTEETIVIFQSILPGEEPSLIEPLMLVCGNYEDF